MSDSDAQSSAVDEQKVIGSPHEAPASRAEKEQVQAAADFANDKHDGKAMRVKIYSPFRSYFDGQAQSISAVNGTGPFDILPKHHNFISLLSACDLVVRTKEGAKKIIISGGIMHVKADQVIVFLDV